MSSTRPYLNPSDSSIRWTKLPQQFDPPCRRRRRKDWRASNRPSAVTAFTATLDADKDGALTRDEFTEGFAKWFGAWNTDQSGALTEEQLRAGINRDLAPSRFPPGGPPPPEP